MPKKRRLPGHGKSKSKGKDKKLRPFHQFSRLPAELRTRVWDLVDAEPRVVELRYHRDYTKKRGTREQIRCLSRAPAVLHGCRESRRIIIQRNLYQRAFVRPLGYNWVNFAADMISIGPLDSSWLGIERTLIQRFRFESENDECFFHFQSWELNTMTSLKELHIICLDGVTYWIDIAEERGFPKENVFFMAKGIASHMYSRREMMERFPSRQFPEYSSSHYRQLYDKRIKGTLADVPEELWFGVSEGELPAYPLGST
ncbi:uncharacterized protein F5Z01DRAFT_659143 [Emericellopsis atlantica]|uniref:2EXR domain-containing protein n=1 Tax=Emericellopsis atlantica TaxID=2614577 RepID=A0A9P7ZK08_9HYPO|nr:uncharacterized protein F5Z01DRAFT_659143 [Emericellopsis atlantica]KAG9253097.1 hypothetical protein F5Z01DRAFT_659143 [Emericellopsis atlantica]